MRARRLGDLKVNQTHSECGQRLAENAQCFLLSELTLSENPLGPCMHFFCMASSVSKLFREQNFARKKEKVAL